jgi:hypothetical protein
MRCMGKEMSISISQHEHVLCVCELMIAGRNDTQAQYDSRCSRLRVTTGTKHQNNYKVCWGKAASYFCVCVLSPVCSQNELRRRDS